MLAAAAGERETRRLRQLHDRSADQASQGWRERVPSWGARFARRALLCAGLGYAVHADGVQQLSLCGPMPPPPPSSACFTKWVCSGGDWVESGFRAAGTSCNDGSLCTANDACDGFGNCTGTPTCNPNQCQVLASCNPTTGACSYQAKANGTSCNDGNACTQTDTCQAGACAGSNPVTCTALDLCHLVGTCNSATGYCSNPPKAMDDQKACTIDRCDPATGAITHTALVSEADCSSGTYFCHDKYGNVTRKVVCVTGVPCDTTCQ